MIALMPVEFEVQRVSTSASIPDNKKFKLWAETALAGKGEDFSFGLRIVDEEEAQRFNREYRQKDYATNVLSFPSDLPEALPEELRKAQLGDLLICAPLVAREAIEQQRSEADHWAHLLVHGVLHLLGYDHEQADEADEMESLETEILAKLGIDDPYKQVD
jgi:probable rRNA maturation factor